VTLPRQGSLNRLQRFDVRPNRELGQNFLVDDNILRLIGDAAELGPEDVALEVGGGLGVLSEHRLEAPLRDALDPHTNTTLHFADAVALDLDALDPPPTKVVANLPYGVAATVLLRTVAELPAAQLWVAMVQREVGERLASAPGSKVYGATSVLAQLACDVRVLRRVPATVFHPRPNVESAIVVLRRRGPSPAGHVVALVHAAFAHRRKALPGSLGLDPGAPDGLRAAARVALEQLDLPADARAERLTPGQFARLAELIGRGLLEPLKARRG
jgi:16S rRNA (adenine1518-N6/adenine1519-N6)-dimethyltransferase